MLSRQAASNHISSIRPVRRYTHHIFSCSRSDGREHIPHPADEAAKLRECIEVFLRVKLCNLAYRGSDLL